MALLLSFFLVVNGQGATVRECNFSSSFSDFHYCTKMSWRQIQTLLQSKLVNEADQKNMQNSITVRVIVNDFAITPPRKSGWFEETECTCESNHNTKAEPTEQLTTPTHEIFFANAAHTRRPMQSATSYHALHGHFHDSSGAGLGGGEPSRHHTCASTHTQSLISVFLQCRARGWRYEVHNNPPGASADTARS